MFLSFLSYIRCPFALIYSVLSFLFWATTAIIGSFLKKDHIGNLSQQMWCRGILWVAGIRVRVEGTQNIPKGSAIFLFNHASLLDIPVMVIALPVYLRFIAKKELFRIPYFGWAMKSVGTLAIDRSNRSKAINVYQQAAGDIDMDNNLCIALAPEGTRQSGEKLGKFKSGPFIFAIENQLPLVPVVICGANEALPRKSFQMNCGQWKREIMVRILPLTDVTGYSFELRKELKEKVRNEMVQTFEELKKH